MKVGRLHWIVWRSMSRWTRPSIVSMNRRSQASATALGLSTILTANSSCSFLVKPATTRSLLKGDVLRSSGVSNDDFRPGNVPGVLLVVKDPRKRLHMGGIQSDQADLFVHVSLPLNVSVW